MSRAADVQKSEINITPFVDVMLVLLIVFMVTAPLATTHLDLTIPPPGDSRAPPVAPVFVSLQKNGTLHVGSARLGESSGDWRSLPALLRAKAAGKFAMPVFVRADRDVAYGDVMRLIDELRVAGYSHVSIVTENPDT